jgi:hypothetical protein
MSVLSTASIDEWPPEHYTRMQVDRMVVSVVDRREAVTNRYDGCRESSIRCRAYFNVRLGRA